MGQSIEKIRKEAKYNDDIDKREKEERLRVLEKMVKGHLSEEQTRIINGERGDQEIHSGTIVEEFKEVNLVLTSTPSEDLTGAIDSFFEGNFLGGLHKLVNLAIKAVLGNSSLGEYESSSMFIVWSHDALVRIDTYVYRWNFSSQSVIDTVEGALGILMFQRVVDLTKTDPQVLTWAIARQSEALEVDPTTAIDNAIAVIKKAAELQLEVKKLQDKVDEETPKEE